MAALGEGRALGPSGLSQRTRATERSGDLATAKPALNGGRRRQRAALPWPHGDVRTPPHKPWGATIHHSRKAKTLGTHSSLAFPRLRGSLVIFLPGFQKKCRGGVPYEFLENKRRHTKEEQRGREGGSQGEIKMAHCCWTWRGRGGV